MKIIKKIKELKNLRDDLNFYKDKSENQAIHLREEDKKRWEQKKKIEEIEYESSRKSEKLNILTQLLDETEQERETIFIEMKINFEEQFLK